MSYHINAEEVFEIGLEIEKNGQHFYELAAEKSQDEPIRDLCRELATWEQSHVSVFEALRRKLPEADHEDVVFDPESEEAAYVKALADSHVFLQNRKIIDMVAQCHTVEALLDMAISFEKDSVLFYNAIKPLVLPEHGQGDIDKLIQEEMKHIATLMARKKQLK